MNILNRIKIAFNKLVDCMPDPVYEYIRPVYFDPKQSIRNKTIEIYHIAREHGLFNIAKSDVEELLNNINRNIK